MNIQWNIETAITLFAIITSSIGSLLIIRLSWKRYGLLLLLSAVVGEILCYVFVYLGFYSFPYRLFPQIATMPFETILTVFPFYVLLAVRYSPAKWSHKIFFYMTIVHLGMLGETLAHNFTNLIHYEFEWDLWDSYTWWWIYFLFFETVGGKIVPNHLRRPIHAEAFRSGNWAWAVFHFVVTLTVFLGGYYLGVITGARSL